MYCMSRNNNYIVTDYISNLFSELESSTICVSSWEKTLYWRNPLGTGEEDKDKAKLS